jgi:hypothetical protein
MQNKAQLLAPIHARIAELDYTETKTKQEAAEERLLLFVHDLLSRDENPNATNALADMVYSIVAKTGTVDMRNVLRAEITGSGLSQLAICEAIGIRPATLSNYLNGKTKSLLAYEDVLNYVINRGC